MTMDPFKFGGAQKPPSGVLELTVVEEAKNALDTTFNTFFSVVDPFVIQDSIPRDLRAISTKQGGPKQGAAGVKSSFEVFNTFEDAAMHAQRMNRPLVIMEIKAVSKVRPQLPLVEKISEKTG